MSCACPESIVQALENEGLKLSMAGNKIKLAPKALVTRNMIALLREHRQEIIDLLLAGQEKKPQPLPYLKNESELIIPMDAPDKYKWWAGGQSVLDTLLELDASDSVIDHYVCELQQPEMWERWQKILEERIAARPVAGLDITLAKESKQKGRVDRQG